VGPRWQADSGSRDDALLASCYLQSLRIADDLGCERVAFPSISTGIYGFPVDRAATVAVAAIRDALQEYPEIAEVRLVCFSTEDRAAYEQAVAAAD
jgi:O-acetyl-ADP-ribose deacetylase (regulator of RNase III)